VDRPQPRAAGLQNHKDDSGYQHRPEYLKRKKFAEWEAVVEKLRMI
jgi:hypothetical protein